MAILIFIVKFIMSSGLLYGYYHFFLRNHPFHHYNRFYLIGIALLSCVVPFLQIPVKLFAGVQQPLPLIHTLGVIVNNKWEEPVNLTEDLGGWQLWINMQTVLLFIYAGGVMAGLIALMRSVLQVIRIKRRYPARTVQGLTLYETNEPGTPFSFFNAVFWNNDISLSGSQGQQIFRHEVFHVKEKHSADNLLLEILCCIAWFNPFFHLIKNELKTIHEFSADEYAVSASNRYTYAELLVLRTIYQKTPSVSHPFFNNHIKRRVTMMLHSNLVKQSNYLSRIITLPLVFVLVSAFTVQPVQPTLAKGYTASKSITVVIDPGHGGIFSGVNVDNLVEKDITLGISTKIKELSAGYNINVVLTRIGDNLVGNATNLKEDLQNRIAITKQSKPDLFISIHTNATAEKATQSSGFEAWISGRNEHTKDRQAASALLNSLKKVYAVNEVVQQKQIGIIVLDKSNCPAVCIECGYMNNAKDGAFVTAAANQEMIARQILEGIAQYWNAQHP